ncbi:hypothetical protein [Sphingomonas yantingensis]|uniref:Uncharacterized protein n=1 Tax=Sphingomonas yantingensis TaxID=1241761 RepID=A0A7W9ALW1_9SPHN|nr:hypothetical protein [Sphingomonas yantingensis]MBB5696845.1 hypothetical protein [Sphingomonas yantingensis]
MSLTPVQQNAYDDVRGRLESGFLNPVTHGDVNAAAATLKSLNAADANAVVAEMEKSGQLDKLASEGVDGTWFGNGGYTDGERRDLFNDLAGKLTGSNLAAVSNAFERSKSGEGGFDLAGEFASSVATHASAAQKVDFIKQLTSEASDGKGLSGVNIGGSWSREVDGDAAAIGTVLGSLRGGQAEAAFRHLAANPAALSAVTRTGIDQTSHYSQGGVVTGFDTARFRGVMDAAASISNPDLKARVFDAGATELRTIRDTPGISLGVNSIDRGEALGDVRDSLTKLIDSDTTGVVHELETNSETRAGSALSAYTQQMFEGDKADTLGEQMARLQLGNDATTRPQDPVARLNQTVKAPDGTDRRENAAALGYFVGAAYAGAAAQADGIKGQQDNVTAMLKSVGAIVGAATGPVGGAITGAGGEWLNKAVEAAIDNPKLEPAQRLESAALPSVANDPDAPFDREVAVGDKAESAFGDAVDRVRRNAQP